MFDHVTTLFFLCFDQIFLVRNKDNTNSAVRFLFGESLKKKNISKEDDHTPTGCCARMRLCNSQSESSMGDSALSQEIETLKQLIKEVTYSHHDAILSLMKKVQMDPH